MTELKIYVRDTYDLNNGFHKSIFILGILSEGTIMSLKSNNVTNSHARNTVIFELCQQ